MMDEKNKMFKFSCIIIVLGLILLWIVIWNLYFNCTDSLTVKSDGVDDTGLSLGIEGYMTDSNGFSNYGLPSGFYISKISSDSNASNSSLEIGNIITAIDGTNVTSVDTLRKVLNKKNHGDKVLLKVKYASKNEYKEKEVTIELK